jgi:lysophospholipase L1-like esterase
VSFTAGLFLAGCSAQPRAAELAHPSPKVSGGRSVITATPAEPGALARPPASAAPGLPSGDKLTPEISQAPRIVDIAIEDPSGRALEAFYAGLRRAEEKRGQARIVVYGASHVASDLYTDVIRDKLQARFGDAGAGFVQPLRAVSGYRNAGIAFEDARGWTGVHVKARTPVYDRYGLGGIYIGAEKKKPARASFFTRAHGEHGGTADQIELWYLKQPRGGRLRIAVDGAQRTLNTRAAKPKPAYERFELHDTPHRVELSSVGDAQVHVFGLALERSVPGVIVDTLGIPGSRARYHLLWDDAIYREHLARRKPDLLILAYGTNESGDDDEPIANYRADLRKVLERAREVVPAASCLLVGPSDRPLENPDGTFVDRPRTKEVNDVQRSLAAEFGCGFFDVVAFMGGPLSMLRWVNALPPLGTPDYVHFTRLGYEALGNVLLKALMSGFPSPEPISAPLPPTAARSHPRRSSD